VWIASAWRDTENNRRTKFYSLTPGGRSQIEKELATWKRLSGAVGLIAEMG
jgi:hypothetical protein